MKLNEKNRPKDKKEQSRKKQGSKTNKIQGQDRKNNRTSFVSKEKCEMKFKEEKDAQKQPGKEKKKSKCPYLEKCGGCRYIDVLYEKQLLEKEKEMKALLGKYGKVQPVLGMENPFHYRHKVHAVFGYEKGGVISGIYEEKSHRIVNVDSCFLEHEKADEIILTIRELLKSFKIRAYDEKTDYGLLKHVVVRVGAHTGQIMVILVLRSPILPSKNNFAKALVKKHPEISTIVLNVNEKNTTMVLGTRDIVLYGKGFIEDELCGMRFRLSPQSFYQINPLQTEVLYNKAMEFAALTGKERVIDAYCGTGTIGLIASKKAAEVIGIELNKEAVKDAVTNAKMNGVKNITFIKGDAGEKMIEMAAQKEKVDVVLMDPPRSGSSEAFLNSLCMLSPEKIVYISCGPESLERDLGYLVKHKYKVEKIQPVDLFCHTTHVETVCLLSRKA